MDDRTYWLVIAIMVSSVLVIVVSGLANFDVSPGFWAIPGGVITLLATRGADRSGGGKPTDPIEPPAQPKEEET